VTRPSIPVAASPKHLSLNRVLQMSNLQKKDPAAAKHETMPVRPAKSWSSTLRLPKSSFP
jgi:hypothetical protein